MQSFGTDIKMLKEDSESMSYDNDFGWGFNTDFLFSATDFELRSIWLEHFVEKTVLTVLSWYLLVFKRDNTHSRIKVSLKLRHVHLRMVFAELNYAHEV